MKSLFFLFAITLPIFVFSQNNFQNARIISLRGDTISGLINLKNWSKNPKKIEFKTNLDDTSTIYQPNDLRSFQITNIAEFVSYIGQISLNKNRFPDVDNYLDTTRKNDTVFLKQIFKGKNILLFSMRDDLKIRFFYKEADNKPKELEYFQYLSNNHNTTRHYKPYIGVLIQLFEKYGNRDEAVKPKLQKINFSEIDLIHAFQLIDESFSDKSKTSYQARLFLGTAVTFSKISYKQYPYYLRHPLRFQIGVDLATNPSYSRFLFRGELTTSYFNLRSDTRRINQIGEELGAMNNHKVFMATISPTIVYNIFNKEKCKIFISSGVNASLIYVKDFLPTASNYWFYFPITAGLSINRMEFFVQYNTPTGVDSSIPMQMQLTNIGINYLINRGR